LSIFGSLKYTQRYDLPPPRKSASPVPGFFGLTSVEGGSLDERDGEDVVFRLLGRVDLPLYLEVTLTLEHERLTTCRQDTFTGQEHERLTTCRQDTFTGNMNVSQPAAKTHLLVT